MNVIPMISKFLDEKHTHTQKQSDFSRKLGTCPCYHSSERDTMDTVIFAIWEPDFTTLHRPHHDLWPAWQGVFCHSQTWQWQNPSETKNLTCCLVIHIKYHQTYIFSNMATAAGRQERYIFIYIYIFATTHRHDDMIFPRGILINSESCQLTPSEQSETGAATFKLLGFTMAIAKCQVLWLECQTFGMWAHVIFHECHESDVQWFSPGSWIAFGGSVAFPPIGHGTLADFFALRRVNKNLVGISKRR